MTGGRQVVSVPQHQVGLSYTAVDWELLDKQGNHKMPGTQKHMNIPDRAGSGARGSVHAKSRTGDTSFENLALPSFPTQD